MVEETVNRDVGAEHAQNRVLPFPHPFPDEPSAIPLIANLKSFFWGLGMSSGTIPK